MQETPSPAEILSIMRLAVADLDDRPDLAQGSVKACDYFTFKMAFSKAIALSFPNTISKRLSCVEKATIKNGALFYMVNMSILDSMVIEYGGLRPEAEVRQELLMKNFRELSRYDLNILEKVAPNGQQLEDLFLVQEEDIRPIIGNGKQLDDWPTFLAERALVHLKDWEAKQIQDATPPKAPRLSGRRL